MIITAYCHLLSGFQNIHIIFVGAVVAENRKRVDVRFLAVT